MSKIYVFDALGLAKLAVIFHDKLTEHVYFKKLSKPSYQDKFITTETSIIVAFDIISKQKRTNAVKAMMIVVQNFFDETKVQFEIERKERAKMCADFGKFSQNTPSNTPVFVKDACFVATEIYPGSIVIGENHSLYINSKVKVFE